ncbi:MAG: PASTA domain-containing protein [Gemmatimonadota bacterium]|nr:PASTA domain-containing protein [Gemmatimonadota bacterium]
MGPILAKLALKLTPLASFDDLIPIDGLADFRVAGLVRALEDVDPVSFSPESRRITALLSQLDGLLAENAVLRAEVDRLYTGSDSAGLATGPVMLLREVAASVAGQTEQAAVVLRENATGIRLAGLELHLDCGAAAMNDEVALNFSTPGAGSALRLSFSPAEASSSAAEDIVVPDVTGYTPALARRKLTDRKLGFIVSALADAEGIVESQKPTAGDRVAEGTVVRLLVR